MIILDLALLYDYMDIANIQTENGGTVHIDDTKKILKVLLFSRLILVS